MLVQNEGDIRFLVILSFYHNLSLAGLKTFVTFIDGNTKLNKPLVFKLFNNLILIYSRGNFV